MPQPVYSQQVGVLHSVGVFGDILSDDRHPAYESTMVLTLYYITIADVAEEEDGGMVENIKLGLLFASWYLANIYFNMYVSSAHVHHTIHIPYPHLTQLSMMSQFQ